MYVISFNIFIGKPVAKRSIWKTDTDGGIILEWILREVGWKDVEWIYLAECRDLVVGCCEHTNGPLGSIKGEELLD
jgi:hypothetical protein